MPWAALGGPCPASPLHRQQHRIQAPAGARLCLNTKGEEEEKGRLGTMLVPSKRDKPAPDQLSLFLLWWQCTPIRQQPAPGPAEGDQGTGRTRLTSPSEPRLPTPRGWGASLSAKQLVPHNPEQEGDAVGHHVWPYWAPRHHFTGADNRHSDFNSTTAAVERKQSFVF